jgi:hypothetical protein
MAAASVPPLVPPTIISAVLPAREALLVDALADNEAFRAAVDALVSLGPRSVSVMGATRCVTPRLLDNGLPVLEWTGVDDIGRAKTRSVCLLDVSKCTWCSAAGPVRYETQRLVQTAMPPGNDGAANALAQVAFAMSTHLL